MSNSTIVRTAEAEDAPVIARFNVAMAWETEQKRLHPDMTLAGVKALMARPAHGFYLVASSEAGVMGCLMITSEWSDWRNGLFWWIQSVYVDPQHRRCGVFRALYEEARNRALAHGEVCGLRLYVERHNASAQHTYTTLGMQETDYRMFEIEFQRRAEV